MHTYMYKYMYQALGSPSFKPHHPRTSLTTHATCVAAYPTCQFVHATSISDGDWLCKGDEVEYKVREGACGWA